MTLEMRNKIQPAVSFNCATSENSKNPTAKAVNIYEDCKTFPNRILLTRKVRDKSKETLTSFGMTGFLATTTRPITPRKKKDNFIENIHTLRLTMLSYHPPLPPNETTNGVLYL